MLEVDLHPKNMASRGIELELVVVTKPVVFRPTGDGADRG
jgi:hypothetical protein